MHACALQLQSALLKFKHTHTTSVQGAKSLQLQTDLAVLAVHVLQLSIYSLLCTLSLRQSVC